MVGKTTKIRPKGKQNETREVKILISKMNATGKEIK